MAFFLRIRGVGFWHYLMVRAGNLLASKRRFAIIIISQMNHAASEAPMLHRFSFLTMAALLALTADAAHAGDKKVRVVIIDGQNNHDWRSTTPVMKKALEDSGRFTVDVA